MSPQSGAEKPQPGARGLAGRIAGAAIGAKITPLLMIGILLLGILAVASTPREEEPQITVPTIDVTVTLPGSPPEEIENLIAVPLERQLGQIAGIEYLYSASRTGAALVTARFGVGEDPEASLVKVFEKLAGFEPPAGASPPAIRTRSIDDVPILVLTLASGRYSAAELRRLAVELEHELAPLDGVAAIRIVGGERRQVRIELDPRRLAAARIDPGGLAALVQAQNTSLEAGVVATAGAELTVRTGGFLADADEVGRLIVSVHGTKPIRLRDLGQIEDGSADVSNYVYYGRGGPGSAGFLTAVTLSVTKLPGFDAAEVAGRIHQRLDELRPRLLPAEVELAVTRDYGETGAAKADELLLHLAVAILAVSLLLAWALGWRAAVVVLVSVPLSFALTLLTYYLLGYTLNRVTLFALVFVTGIVVDDSIIVVENMVRHLARRAPSPLQAAIEAVDQVGNPTILATLTVIASLLPMALVRGLMGPYMRPMPVGATLAMTFSLLVALVAAPYLGFRFLRSFEDEIGHGSSRMQKTYRRLLASLLASARRRHLFFAAVALLLLASLALVPAKLVKVKMLPFDDKNELQVMIDMPEGTTLERSAQAARAVAEAMRQEVEVADVTFYAGTASPVNFNGLVRYYDQRRGGAVADVSVRFQGKGERLAQSHDLAKRFRPRIEALAKRYGGVFKIAEVPPGPPVLATLVAEVYGPDAESRRQVAERVADLFRQHPGVADVDWSVEARQPGLLYEVDHEKSGLAGIPAAQVAAGLRLAVSGQNAGLLHLAGEREPLPLTLSVPPADAANPGTLESIAMISPQGQAVALSELVRSERREEAPSRLRKNRRPVVYVTAEVKGAQESPVYAMLELSENMAALRDGAGKQVEVLFSGDPERNEIPTVRWDGEWQITYEVFRDLGLAFAGVLLLIYLVIAGFFGSLRSPLVMMLAIPLSLIGILPVHALFGAFFTATSMIGFIALAGILVRNSVLLLDFVEIARSGGARLDEAILEAGTVRLRPILLTAGAVSVGSFVILFDPIFQGLAIALLAGTAVSTLLTLLVVPLVYFAFEKAEAR